MKRGFVSLVGAGPGHPDYLSVKGLRRIREADVVLYDALIGQDILSLFPVGCARFYCGKRCGQHSFTQDQINTRLILLAQMGKRVVRLKGGDPFLFGRGAEEAIALSEAGVSFEVVPGMSAFSSIGDLDSFSKSIMDQQDVLTPIKDAFNNLMIIEKMKESGEKRKWVNV